MQVTATVVDSAAMRVTKQPTTLVISAADAARGSVEVPDAVVVSLGQSATWVLEFRRTRAFISSARIHAHGVDADVTDTAAALLPAQASREPIRFNYVFRLAAGVTPGVYPWPVVVSALPF